MQETEFTLLWSDFFIWLLVIVSAIWLIYAFRKEHWRNSFKRVGRDKFAMLCLCILCIYGAIGLLDSLHFYEIKDKQRGNIHSLLDTLLEPSLLKKVEKTYSAPLAHRAFMKETLVEGDKQFRDFPRLKYGGAHLKNDQSHLGDLLTKAALGLLVSIALIFVAFYLVFFMVFIFRPKDQPITVTPNSKTTWLDAILTLVKNTSNYAQVRTLLIKNQIFLIFTAIIISLFSFSFLFAIDYHVLGTDKTGNDVLYIAIKSIRTGLMIGTLTTLIVTPFAILFGSLAGYFGGWVDDIIQYIYTTLSSIPSILLIAAAMLILNARYHNSTESTAIIADEKLLWLCVILGITSWTGLCRLIRGEVLKLKNIEYVQAADAFGVGRISIMLKHLVPNVMHIVLISMVLRFSGLVLVEAVLAYIGIGVDPSVQSWGNMINTARLELAREPVIWWNLIASFVFMVGLVLPANIFGDAVRDALDPRLRGKDAA